MERPDRPNPKNGHQAERVLHKLLLDQRVDEDVLDYILPHGKPHGYETALWDYKRDLPNLNAGKSGDQSNNIKISELIKDAVSFYNTYGGYILAGIDQFGGAPIYGIDQNALSYREFTIDKFNEQLFRYTKLRIECRAADFFIECLKGEKNE